MLWSDTLDNIREQVNRGFDRRNQEKIKETFDLYRAGSGRKPTKRDELGRFHILRPCSAGAWLIQKDELLDALRDLDVEIGDVHIDQVFHIMDMDDNQGLDREEFKKALQAS